MDTYDFKNDLTGSVFRLMQQLIKPFGVFMVVYFIIMALFTYLLVPADFFDFYTELISSASKSAGDPMASAKINSELFNYFMANLSSLGVLTLILIVLGMISYNFYFDASKNVIEHNDNSFSSGFTSLLDIRVGHYFLVYLILTVTYQGLSMLLQSVSTNPMLMGLISLIYAFTIGGVYGWFHLAYSKIGLGNSSFIEGFKFAWKEMTFSRVAKTVGIFILFAICATILLGIAGAIVGLLAAFVPYAGIAIGVILIAIAMAVIMAFSFAGLSGLYYRYTDDNHSKEEFIVTD